MRIMTGIYTAGLTPRRAYAVALLLSALVGLTWIFAQATSSEGVLATTLDYAR